MDRKISERAVLDIINHTVGHELMAEKVKELPPAESGWNPITVKTVEGGYEIVEGILPEDGEEVLITYGYFVELDTFCVDAEGCYFEGRQDISEVDAWMPLPEPYKGVSS